MHFISLNICHKQQNEVFVPDIAYPSESATVSSLLRSISYLQIMLEKIEQK